MKSVFFLSLMNGGAWGGSEEIWYRTALWMCKNNYKVGIGCFDWEGKQERLNKLKQAGCIVYLLPNKKGLFKNRAIKKILDLIPFAEYNLTAVNQGGWEEILHAPFKDLYKRLPNYVILNHNYYENATLSSKKQKLLKQWLTSAQMNFGATGKIFEVIEKKFSINVGKKTTLVNPITFQPETEPSAYPPLTNEGCTWVMLAELDLARKSQDLLVNVLASAKWKERNWQLHFYGKGKDMGLLEGMIKLSGLENKIFLKGFTTDIKRTLQSCHALLQCTRIDAMPIAVVEAMAMARPCVVSNIGDMPLWVQDEFNGFVCTDTDEQGIDQALEKCWQQKNNWEIMGKRSFDIFIKKYPQPYEEKVADMLVNSGRQ